MITLDINSAVNDNGNYIIKKYNGLFLIKYDKTKLNSDNIDTLGLFRSVITDGENIISFAPPKSTNYNSFIVNNDFKDCNITEFIDGTMIHVFYNTRNVNKNGNFEPKWELATRSNIGANCKFNLNANKSFREMFYDACVPMNEKFSDFFKNLNKDYCYSFVLQHPENRIVHKIDEACLYLTNVYKFENNNIHIINYNDNPDAYLISEHIKRPRNIEELYPEISNWEYINLLCSGEQTSFELQGFIIVNNNNERTKIRNLEYEKIKRIRGNSPKLQYQFLELYKKNKVSEYLNYFPEHREQFMTFKRNFYKWSEKFYNFYIDCFIEKNMSLSNCQYEFKPLLYFLHKHYIEELRPKNKKVNFTFLKEYIKHIPTEKIMFSMNYKYRELKNENKLNNHIQEQINKQSTV